MSKMIDVSDADIEGVAATLSGRIESFIRSHWDLEVVHEKVSNGPLPGGTYRFYIEGANCRRAPGNYQCFIRFARSWRTAQTAERYLRHAAASAGLTSRLA